MSDSSNNAEKGFLNRYLLPAIASLLVTVLGAVIIAWLGIGDSKQKISNATKSTEIGTTASTANERLPQAAWANRKWWRETADKHDVITVTENGKIIQKVGDSTFVHHIGDDPNEFVPETAPFKDTVDKWRVASSTEDELVLIEHRKGKKGLIFDTPAQEVVINYTSLESEKWRRTRKGLIWLGVAIGLFVVACAIGAASSKGDDSAAGFFGCGSLIVLVIAIGCFVSRLMLNSL